MFAHLNDVSHFSHAVVSNVLLVVRRSVHYIDILCISYNSTAMSFICIELAARSEKQFVVAIVKIINDEETVCVMCLYLFIYWFQNIQKI